MNILPETGRALYRGSAVQDEEECSAGASSQPWRPAAATNFLDERRCQQFVLQRPAIDSSLRKRPAARCSQRKY